MLLGRDQATLLARTNPLLKVLILRKKVVSALGLEPRTYRLKVGRFALRSINGLAHKSLWEMHFEMLDKQG